MGVELFPDGTDACFPCLSLLESFVELVLEFEDVCFGGGRCGDALDPQLLLLHGVLAWREDGVEDVLCVCGLDVGLAECFFVVDLLQELLLLASRDQHRVAVLQERRRRLNGLLHILRH